MTYSVVDLLQSSKQDIIALAYLKELELTESEDIPAEASTEVIDENTTLYIHLEGVDFQKEVSTSSFTPCSAFFYGWLIFFFS